MSDALNKSITVLGRTYNVHEVIRIIAIIGAYALLRPYLLKLSEKFQERDHARPLNASAEHNSPAATGGSQSSTLKSIGDDDAESDGEDMSWGAKARRRARDERRQRKFLMEEEERARAEEESDEDIAEYLDKPE
ncbi:protein trafficking Pga2 [Peziza echinospora]|nr:protein trafficking Pga2 [Peziza echinospora]